MFDIEKITNKITLTRGDSAELEVVLSDELSATYEMQESDCLIFTMKKSFDDTVIALKKKVIGTNIFNFVPADTKKLSFGKYYYDIQLETASGEVYTVIPSSEFVVGEEISE